MKKLISGIKNFLACKKQSLKNMLTQSKEASKKFAKAYFCFWQEGLFVKHLLAFILLVTIFLLIDSVFDIRLWMALETIFFITLGHLLTAAILGVIYIETPSMCDILLVGNQPKVLSGPIWAKGTRYVIEKFHISLNNKVVFNFNAVCPHGNTTIFIPLTVTLSLTGSFDKLELFNVLFEKQMGKTTLSLHEYVQSLICINDEIDTVIEQYVYQEISCPDFLDQAAEFITFPENSFSNVESVSIRLEEPSFSSCK